MKAILAVVACCALCCYADCGVDPDAMEFPGPTARKLPRSNCNSPQKSNLAAELELARKLSSFETLEEMYSFLNISYDPDYRTFLDSRAGIDEKSSGENPQPVKCKPQLQVVSLVDNLDPSLTYYPSCTMVKRCGGCCNHASLSCQPIANATRNFKVVIRTVNGRDRKSVVQVEEHTDCECLCKIKEEHCTSRQIYLPSECRCACTNPDEEQKCGSNKWWNENVCACMCRTPLDCSTGFYFDENTCSCKKVPIANRWFSDWRTTSYDYRQTGRPLETPVIFPLDPDDPRRRHKEDPEY